MRNVHVLLSQLGLFSDLHNNKFTLFKDFHKVFQFLPSYLQHRYCMQISPNTIYRLKMEIQAMGAKPLTKYQHKIYFPTYGMESRISTRLSRRIGRFKPLGTYVQNTSDTFLGSCMISFVELQIYCRTTIPKVTVAFLFIDSFPT